MGKKALCLIFAFLLSINSFAAVVSDNDGAAFVTKAEFETLKQNFDDQVTNYNNSIDSKLDGSIASYLAGVQLHKETWIETNIDVLDYPLTIIDKLNNIETCTTGDTNLSDQTTLWMPGWVFFTSGWRDACVFTEKWEQDQIDNIKYYLNGTADTTGGTFKVSNICKEPTLIWRNAFLHEDCGNGEGWGDGNEYFANSMYLDSNSTYGTGTQDGVYCKRQEMRANYNKLWDTDDYTVHVMAWHHAGHGSNVSAGKGSNQDKYDYFKDDNYMMRWGTSTLPAGWKPDTNFSKEYTYSNIKLDRIYNYGISANNSHFAPVTYNNVLKFTNKKANRKSFTRTKLLSWYGRTIDSKARKTMKWMISAGENLEHEAEDTGREWYKKSLISANRIVYDFKTPDDSVIANHKMVNGIPIFFVSKEFRTEAVQGLKIEFDLTTRYAANPKYVIVSKKPITTQVYSDDVSSNNDYVVISKINGLDINAKKGTIRAGKNTIEIKDDTLFDLNDVVYMKILWNDTYVSSSIYDESVIITKPTIAYRAAG